MRTYTDKLVDEFIRTGRPIEQFILWLEITCKTRGIDSYGNPMENPACRVLPQQMLPYQPEKMRYGVFCHSFSRDQQCYWFRVFGFGYALNWSYNHRPLFSERMGITKTAKIGRLRIKPIHP